MKLPLLRRRPLPLCVFPHQVTAMQFSPHYEAMWAGRVLRAKQEELGSGCGASGAGAAGPLHAP